MSNCQKIAQGEINPWNSRAVVATAVVAGLTLIVCSVLAILVNQHIIPPALSVNHLLITGIAGGVFFGLLSLVIRYCCCRSKKQNGSGSQDQTDNNGDTGNSFLHNNGKGKVGNKGDTNRNKNTFTINSGKKNDPLKN